jgi:hypothetical protein
MPQQETVFEEKSGELWIRVLKTYDHGFAQEAFDGMSETADAHLWESLGIDDLYDPTDIPASGDPTRRDFLWDEIEDAAREDGNLCSFFVVAEVRGDAEQYLYVAPDWPNAEAFARDRMQPVA